MSPFYWKILQYVTIALETDPSTIKLIEQKDVHSFGKSMKIVIYINKETVMDIEKILLNTDISNMEKMLIIHGNREEFDPINYAAAVIALNSNSHYCASCGVYYDINKCEISEISKELTCTPNEEALSIFDLLNKKKTKTVTIKTIRCPLGHRAILDHSEV